MKEIQSDNCFCGYASGAMGQCPECGRTIRESCDARVRQRVRRRVAIAAAAVFLCILVIATAFPAILCRGIPSQTLLILSECKIVPEYVSSKMRREIVKRCRNKKSDRIDLLAAAYANESDRISAISLTMGSDGGWLVSLEPSRRPHFWMFNWCMDLIENGGILASIGIDKSGGFWSADPVPILPGPASPSYTISMEDSDCGFSVEFDIVISRQDGRVFSPNRPRVVFNK